MTYRYAVLTAQKLAAQAPRRVSQEVVVQGGWVHIDHLMNPFVKNDCGSMRNEIPYLHRTRRLIYSIVQR